jgi:pyruvate,water dikinase
VSLVLRFDEASATDQGKVGGKGANLGRLTAAGFPVPMGFSITTDAYLEAVSSREVGAQVLALAGQIDFGDATDVEAKTAEIRSLIVSYELPAEIAQAITEAYRALGDQPYVAVRSSGTAEDLADTSFAGMHDTYLDIRGVEAVLDAVRRCWASMWTARATSYRNTNGFDHSRVSICVVVQIMVESEVSGVMFTANPLTGACDETVINSSWGLGEAIVSGQVTPDQFTVKHDALRIREKVLGEKAIKIVRHPETGVGVTHIPVEESARSRFTLTDSQITDLTELGRTVMEHYDRMPQDIEWAYADGRFLLLQARPVTGVELSWDEAVDAWQQLPDDDDIIWTRAWADDVWTGAISPLMYSYRSYMFDCSYKFLSIWGIPELSEQRIFKYHKAEAYYNANIEAILLKKTMFPMMRQLQMSGHSVSYRGNGYHPAQWHEDILAAPFSYMDFVKLHAKINTHSKSEGFYKWFKPFEHRITHRVEEAKGLPVEEIRRFSDSELRRYCESRVEWEMVYCRELWTAAYMYWGQMFVVLNLILSNWYDGETPAATVFTTLCSGTKRRTASTQESIDLWHLVEAVRRQPVLCRLMTENEGQAFFDKATTCPEGAEFAAMYAEYSRKYYHRGQENRDMVYPRRSEDPTIDYRMIQSLLTVSDPVDPEITEHKVNETREATVEMVIQNLRKQTLGVLKAEAFKLTYNYVQDCLMVRDDERFYVDYSTSAVKRAFLELNRRLMERGLMDTERDFFFLSRRELYDVFEGKKDPLMRAKITARMRDFDRFTAHEISPPMWLHHGKPANFDVGAGEHEGALRGIPTSSGRTTGRARVVPTVRDIGKVRQGDILITNATDPGWTPVFMVASAVIAETGGMLAHFSLLSREYGMPAVQLVNATKLIPDGALISIDGDSGVIEILEELPGPEADAELAPAQG